MKYGLICKVCDRLLWVGNKKPMPGDSMPPEGWLHAKTGMPYSKNQYMRWCECKGPIAYTELVEPK